MRSRRTVESDFTYRLLGGTEDNDLWVKRGLQYGVPTSTSTWVPTEEERQAIAEGANIDLTIMGQGHPPVALALSRVPLGRRPQPEEGSSS